MVDVAEEESQQISIWQLARASAKSPTARQTTVYVLATGAVGLLAVVAQGFITHALTVDEYGVYGFSTSFLQFLAILFEFGLFVPAARMAARVAGQERREVLGGALAAYVPVGLAFCAFTVVASFTIVPLFGFDAEAALRIAAPVAFVYPFGLIGLQLAQGVGRLNAYSISNLVAQVLFVAALAALAVLDAGLSANSALVLRAVTLGLGWVLLVVWLRPLFRRVGDRVRLLVKEAREWGLAVYGGRVLSIGTYNMDVLMLAAFRDPTAVGYYTLAGALAAGVGLPASGFAMALFRRMANERGIRRRWLAFVWATGLASAFVLAAIAGWLIPAVFSDRYQGAVVLVLPLALAQALRGVTNVYNQYLAARGRGRELRTAGLILTGTNLAANFALIPAFGAEGAAWASVIGLIANLGAHVRGYRVSLRAEQRQGARAGET